MAKIATRKSTTLIRVERPEPQRVATPGEPHPPLPKKLVEPAPLLQPVAVERPAVPPVKKPVAAPIATQESAPPPRPVQTAPSAPLPPPTKRRGSPALVLILGLILLGVAYTRLTKSPRLSVAENADPGEKLLLEDERARLRNSLWRNEEPSFLTRIFHKLCLGYATSDGCRDEPLHPFEKLYEDAGKTLNFPEETDRKVIQQTIQYNSRGFAFRE